MSKNIKRLIESNIDVFQLQVQNSNSIFDLCKYYNISYNGQICKYFKQLIQIHNISITHWDYHKLRRKYQYIDKECPVCKTMFTTQQGCRDEKTVCSRKCSNTFFSNIRHTEKNNKKISNGLKTYWGTKDKITRTIICLNCGIEKIVHTKTQKFCSNKCSRKYLVNTSEYILNLKAGAQKSIKEGRHNGWKSRNILSYPEQFFIKVLNNNGIQFETNKPVLSYFLDFVIVGKMIDLEIDGKQHTYPDRQCSDEIRDKKLIENGWKVYRIKWNSVNTSDGKMQMKEKIDNFLEFLRRN